MEKIQAEVTAQLEQDYKQAREKGTDHLRVADLCSSPLQRAAKMTGVSQTLTM